VLLRPRIGRRRCLAPPTDTIAGSSSSSSFIHVVLIFECYWMCFVVYLEFLAHI